jgi:geranylgeranyl pyrophosphate synthase
MSVEDIDHKNNYKTWQYTFARPLTTWALLMWADKKTIKHLEKIWTYLWKAYQIRDDILDITIADGDNTSHYDTKTVFSDIQDWQQTYLTHFVQEKWTHKQRLILRQSLGKSLNLQEITLLRAVFVDSGAISYGVGLLEDYLTKARALIEKYDFPNNTYKKHLYEIIDLLHTI